MLVVVLTSVVYANRLIEKCSSFLDSIICCFDSKRNLRANSLINDDWRLLDLRFVDKDITWGHLFENRQQTLADIVSQLDILPKDSLSTVSSYARRKWNNLEIGDFVNTKDSINRWTTALVSCLKQGSVFVHYMGWPCIWDEWIHPQDQKTRVKPVDLFHSYPFPDDPKERSKMIRDWFSQHGLDLRD